MRARSVVSAGIFLAATLAGGPLSAQAPTALKAPVVAPQPVVPYDVDLLRLAEIMGSLHFLQQLCEGEGSSQWRDQMSALLDAERPDEQRRARLIDRFNRGFESYRSVYRECTGSALAATARYEEEGATIAASLSARYARGG